jgi:O-antigen ligase
VIPTTGEQPTSVPTGFEPAPLPLPRVGLPSLERIQLALVAAVAATSLVSIFAAEVMFLAPAVIVFLIRVVRGRTRLCATPLDGPILAFSVWTLLSASFSPDPVTSHESAKKLVLFTLFYVAIDSLRDEATRGRVIDAVILGGIVLGAGSLLQFEFLGFDTMDNRPRSFLGHYMTASGLLMAVLVLAAARLAFWREAIRPPQREDLQRIGIAALLLAGLTVLKRLDVMAVEGERLFVAGLAAAAAFMVLSRRRWPGPATSFTLTALAIPVCGWAILISRTRNAWLGSLAGLAAVAVLRAPRLLWLLAGGVALILILRPAAVIDRLTVNDASSRDRIYMWQAGVDMIREKPIFGQGPDMILKVYPDYRWPGAPNKDAPHLHNNAFQIAAERGLPCLAWWLWWVAAALGDAYRASRRSVEHGGMWGVASLAVLIAIMVAGLFEYNFGDSEILMLVLLVSALPYTLRREAEPTAA